MIVFDTHALVWWLSDPAKLSTAAKKVIQTSAAENKVIVSTASILEIATLVRRKRLTLATSFEEWLGDVRELPELQILGVSTEIAALAGSFGADVRGDPIDRIIIATALVSKARLVTADTSIRSLDIIRTVW